MVLLHMLCPIESHAKSQAPIAANLKYVGSEVASTKYNGNYSWGDPVKCPAPAKFAFINATISAIAAYPVSCEVSGQGTEEVSVRANWGICYFDCYTKNK